MKKTEYYDKIKECNLFLNADKSNLVEFLQSEGCTEQIFHSGEQIDITDKLAFVIKGSVYAYSSDEKRHLLLRKIEKNEVFGVAGLFSGQKRISQCVAKGNVTLLYFEKDCVKKLLEKDKQVMYNFMSFLSGRIGYLNKKITYLTAGSAERKLAVYLASFDTDEVNIEISNSALSDMLDIGRASLYRAFDKFIADGCIKRNGNSITIVNKALMLEKY